MRVNHQHETNNLASNSGLLGCALSAQNCSPISPEKNAKLQILLSIFALLAICAGMAWGLTRFMHIDFMTAYLATSPGGLDTVAVIAAGSNADMALIMAMQTLRLFSILLTGPAIARFISTYAPKRSA